MSNAAELQTILGNIENLVKQGKTQEAELEKNKILFNQAYTAFEFGTTEALIRNYVQLSNNEKLTIEERKRAAEAVNTIKELESLYTESQGYNNSEEVYHQKATIYTTEKAIEIAQKNLAKLQVQVRAEKSLEGVEILDFDSFVANEDMKDNPYVMAYQNLKKNLSEAYNVLNEARADLRESTSLKGQQKALYRNTLYKKLTAVSSDLNSKYKKEGNHSYLKKVRNMRKFLEDICSKLNRIKSWMLLKLLLLSKNMRIRRGILRCRSKSRCL